MCCGTCVEEQNKINAFVQGINAKTGTTQASGRLTPKICGVNDGMHM